MTNPNTVETRRFPTSAKPTPRQLEYQDWELGLFLHFGIRTFYEGYKDMDERRMSASKFVPSDLDCGKWCQTAKDAGFKYVVMTAKHHDGFCLWPSHYTNFSVAGSSWKAGKGDVVGELREACTRHGLKFGLYYSPFDADSPSYDDPRSYDDYFVNQLTELLTNYGAVDILWLDGCGSEGHTYDWTRIMRQIRTLQPQILLFHMGDPDFRWIGNEDGLAPVPSFNTATGLMGSILSPSSPILSSPQWLPAECNFRMRDVNWFYSDSDAHTVKSLVELMGLYYYSIGRGANLLINIGPDRRGLLPDLDAARLIEFGNEIRNRFRSPFARLTDFARDGDAWTYTPSTPFFVDHVVIKEDLTTGERVRRFRIDIFTAFHGAPITVWEGQNIGHKAICHFPPARARALRLTVLEADQPPILRTLECFNIACPERQLKSGQRP